MNSTQVSERPQPYDLCGELVRVCADDRDVAELVDASLGSFRTANDSAPVAEFHIRCRGTTSPIARGNRIHSGSLMVIADSHKLIAASLTALPWQIHIETFARDGAYAFYYVFEPLLHMVLKRRGLVHWHGAAVQRSGKTILIVGRSGSGKSTTALCLLLNGYSHVADDELFLDGRDGAIRAQGGEMFLHCTEATAQLLPALGDGSGLPMVLRGNRRKCRIDANRFPRALPGGEIACVLFPNVDAKAMTQRRPLSQAETLRRLLTHPPKEYPAVVADPVSLQSQFDICARLAASVPAFEIALGREIERVHRLVAEVLP